MADRSAAEVFGMWFEFLASRPYEERAYLLNGEVLEIWKKTWDFDFTPDQMECDESLVKLGLARQDGQDISYADSTGVFFPRKDG